MATASKAPARNSPQRRKPSRAAPVPSTVPDQSDPHTERNLDKGLEETFPASDPVSISPGAD